MNKTDCEALINSGISELLALAERSVSSVDEIISCFNNSLRNFFINWARVAYKQKYTVSEIEFQADIAFTEALFTFKQKLLAGKIYEGHASVKTVFFGFCQMYLLAHLKKLNQEEKKEKQFSAEAANQSVADNSNNKEELFTLLQGAIKMLDKEDWQIIKWRHLEEKSCDEISRLLAINKESATNRIYRCMERLRNMVQKQNKQ